MKTAKILLLPMHRLILLLAIYTLSACAQLATNKQNEIWERGKAAIKAGLPEDQLLACAGTPYRVAPAGAGADWYYGATNQMSHASSWCVVVIRVEGRRTTDFKTTSANPGGFTDGSSACSFVMDPCVGDGTLHLEALKHGMLVSKMTSDNDASKSQLSGEAARNAGLIGITSMASQMNAMESQTSVATSPGGVGNDSALVPVVSAQIAPATNRSTQPGAIAAAPASPPPPVVGTNSQMHSGNARNVSLSSGANVGYSSTDRSLNSTAEIGSRLSSQDVTRCVEIVPNGFKCEGPSHRYMKNICGTTKLSVWWRLGNDGWSLQHLAPNQCYPVSYYRDDRQVQYAACSWDPNATYGPSRNPCHYN